MYDVVSVVGTQQFSDNGASIMEAVARAKAGMETLPVSLPLPSPSIALPNVQIVSDQLQSVSDTLVLSSSPISSLPTVPIPTALTTSSSSLSSSVLIPSLSSWRPGE